MKFHLFGKNANLHSWALTLIAISLSLLLTATPRNLSGQEVSKQADPAKLIGTWKIVGQSVNGTANKIEGVVMLKHVTGSQFIWIRYKPDTKVVTDAAGGRYTVKGDMYSEMPLYGLGGDFDVIRDKLQTFKWRVEGKKWYSDGQLSNGLNISEIWERVDPDTAAP